LIGFENCPIWNCATYETCFV